MLFNFVKFKFSLIFTFSFLLLNLSTAFAAEPANESLPQKINTEAGLTTCESCPNQRVLGINKHENSANPGCPPGLECSSAQPNTTKPGSK